MKHLLLIFISGILFCGLGCKKKEATSPDEAPTPVFYFDGSVNNQPVLIQAGIADYYMYTNFSQDTANVYQFEGKFKQVNCLNCPNQLRISIRDYKASALNGSIEIDSSIHPMTLNYNQPTSNNFSVQFSPILDPAEIPVSYSWDFGNGMSSAVASPVYKYPDSTNGVYLPQLTVNYKSGCTASSFRELNTYSLSTCPATIEDSPLSGTSTQFYAGGAIGPNTKYYWDFGDSASTTSNTSNLQNPLHNYTQPGFYAVSLIIDNGACTASTLGVFSTLNYSKDCFCRFSVVKLIDPADLNLSKVNVTWTDSKGVVFTSYRTLQPADSYFEILSVENYSRNENNQLTKKIHAKFKCMVSSGATAVPLSGESVFAISYQ